MNALVFALVIGLALAGAVVMVAVLVIVTAGIHGDERRKSLASPPRTRSAALARRMLGAHGAPHSPSRPSPVDSRR